MNLIPLTQTTLKKSQTNGQLMALDRTDRTALNHLSLKRNVRKIQIRQKLNKVMRKVIQQKKWNYLKLQKTISPVLSVINQAILPRTVQARLLATTAVKLDTRQKIAH